MNVLLSRPVSTRKWKHWDIYQNRLWQMSKSRKDSCQTFRLNTMKSFQNSKMKTIHLKKVVGFYAIDALTLTRGVTCLFCGLDYPCPHMPGLEEQVAMAHKLRKEIEKNG